MYEAKRKGTGHYVEVDSIRREHAGRRMKQIDALRQALDEEQFVLHYQPVVKTTDSSLAGAEALIRWEHPDRGLVFPGDFIHDLEASGLIVPVGAWVLEEACRQARDWQDEFPDTLFRVKLNVSASQLSHPDFHDTVVAALNGTGVDTARICFEITESALMDDVAKAWATLRQAKDRGITLALDDFGTGYSSLTHLRRFNLDYLKIDKSFVDGLGRNAEDTAIIEHVIGLAHTLGLKVIAEGIEEAAQFKALRVLGCDFAQGYFFSRPQPAEVITQLLRLSTQEPRPRVDPDAQTPPALLVPGTLIRAS
jgi:EAL domain-containing protein (putative c-di-GMP-specific phosphodiesterase class I)